MLSFRLTRLISSAFRKPPPFSTPFLTSRQLLSTRSRASSLNSANGDGEWNDAWETAWLPDDLSPVGERAPWEPANSSANDVGLPIEADADTQAFVAEMNERWNERRGARGSQKGSQLVEPAEGVVQKSTYDYRVRKHRIHAGLWMKEIEKMEEAKLGDSNASDDLDHLLDSCSE